MRLLTILLLIFTNSWANEIKNLPNIQTPALIKIKGTQKTTTKDKSQKEQEPQRIQIKKQMQPQTIISDKCSPKIKEYESLLTNRKQNNLKNKVFKAINDIKSQLQPFSPTFNCDKKTLEKLEALYQEILNEDLGFGFTTSNNDSNKFCNVYTSNITTNYKTQIQKMSNSLTGNLASQAYFCRGFSNVMLINENTGISDATYIANAKSDIKSAITANKNVPETFKINTIDDNILTEIFRKYGEVTTKGMDTEQRQLIVDSIKEPQLLALQKQINENYGFVDEQVNTVGDLKDKETANLDLSSYVEGYQLSKNQMPLLNSIKNPNGDIKIETQTLRNFRVSEEEMNKTEAQLDDVLNVLSQFNSEK
jgi:hypothetical protein